MGLVIRGDLDSAGRAQADLVLDAIELWKQGNLGAARSLCFHALALEPQHFGAAQLMGSLALQESNAFEALSWYQRALELRPNEPSAYANLGQVFSQLGNHASALMCFEVLSDYRPIDPETHTRRGDALLALGRNAEAGEAYDVATLIDANQFHAQANRALVWHLQGDFERARSGYEQALKHRPDWPLVLSNLGNLHRDLREFDQAVTCYQKALAASPHYGDAYFNLGVVMQELKSFDSAVHCYTRALECGLEGQTWRVLSNRGMAYGAQQKFELALADFDAAIGAGPQRSEVHLNRGNALRALWRLEESRDSYHSALVLSPDNAQVHSNLGQVLREMGSHEQGMAHQQRAYQLAPTSAEIEFNLALALLQQGQMEAGWTHYEARKRRAESAGHFTPNGSKRWTGQENIAGKSILVQTEQGLGDSLQFARYVPQVAQRGAAVVFEVPPVLQGVLGGLSGVNSWHAKGKGPLPETDFHCALLSLPGVLGTRLDKPATTEPYLKADAQRVALWQKRIGVEGFKIGIAWQGSLGPLDRGRSFNVAQFEKLAQIKGVRLISLQKGAGSEQLAHLPEGMEVEDLGPDFDVGDGAFMDSAAVMMSLDLVITSDSALAHLAGALGRPTWVALSHVPDWRWLLGRTDSPWYPNHRLFRQTRWNDWDTVFEEMAEELRSRREIMDE